MKTDAARPDLIAMLFFLIAAALWFYGLRNNVFLLGSAFLFAGAGLLRYKHQRVAGLLITVFGIAFSVAVFAYGIGKDMALRDNALSKPSSPSESASG